MSRSSAQENKSIGKLVCLVGLISLFLAANAIAFEEAYTNMRYKDFTYQQSAQAASPELLTNKLARKNQSQVPPVWLAQRGQGSSSQGIRSKSDVVREVKQRYNAEVLKITLDQNSAIYRVRLLLPSGRIKNVSVNAKR